MTMTPPEPNLPAAHLDTEDWREALFTQAPPTLGNQFDDDPLLPSWLARTLPESILASGQV